MRSAIATSGRNDAPARYTSRKGLPLKWLFRVSRAAANDAASWGMNPCGRPAPGTSGGTSPFASRTVGSSPAISAGTSSSRVRARRMRTSFSGARSVLSPRKYTDSSGARWASTARALSPAASSRVTKSTRLRSKRACPTSERNRVTRETARSSPASTGAKAESGLRTSVSRSPARSQRSTRKGPSARGRPSRGRSK